MTDQRLDRERAMCGHVSVMNVLALYSEAVDEGKWELLDEVFDDDSTFTTAIGVTVRGVANIKTVLQAMTQYRIGPVLHQPFNVHLQFSDDVCVAHSNWLYLGRPGPEVSWSILSAGRYTDRLARGPEGWRLGSRIIYNSDLPHEAGEASP